MSQKLEVLHFSTQLTRKQFLRMGLRIIYSRNFRWVFITVGVLAFLLSLFVLFYWGEWDFRILGTCTISTGIATFLFFHSRSNLLRTYDSTLLSRGLVDWSIGLEGLQLKAGDEKVIYPWSKVALVDINRSGAAFLFKDGFFLLIHDPHLKGSIAQKKLAAWMLLLRVRYEV